MIRTVTFNSGFDEFISARGFEFGEVGDLLDREIVPSGKGVNASRILAKIGFPVTAYALVGDSDLDSFELLLKQNGVIPRLIPVSCKTRRNLTLQSIDNSHPAAHLRAEGFRLEDDFAIRELETVLRNDIRENDIVSIHGSVPIGVKSNVWSPFVNIARESKASVAADVYGQALLSLIGSAEISLCKPNVAEARVLPGTESSNDISAAIAAIQYMRTRDVSLPLVSLGAEGLIFCEGSTFFKASCIVESPKILVGAGDCCMAGLLASLADERDIKSSIVAAVGLAAAFVAGTSISELGNAQRQFVPKVKVETLEIEPHSALSQ